MATAVPLVVVPQRTAAAGGGSVLQDILKIMRENGQITEEQKTELLRRAAEVDQAKIEREKMEKERIGALQAGIDNGRPFLQSATGLPGRAGSPAADRLRRGRNNTRTFGGQEPGGRVLRSARAVRAVPPRSSMESTSGSECE